DSCDSLPTALSPCATLETTSAQAPFPHGTTLSFSCFGTSNVESQCHNGQWLTETCSSPYTFVYDGRCFYRTPEAQSFFSGEVSCQTLANGHLAQPESLQFLTEAKIAFQIFSDSQYYVGPQITYQPYSCNTVEGCLEFWKYLNATQVPLELFDSGEPNNNPAFQPCVALQKNNGLLQDTRCNESSPAICEVNSMQTVSGDCDAVDLPLCGVTGVQYINTQGDSVVTGSTFDLHTQVAITCNGQSVTGRCVGKPYLWYFPHSPTTICGVCFPCNSTFPEIPCATLDVGTSSLASYEPSTTIKYNCAMNTTATATCKNSGEWEVTDCPNRAQLFDFGGKCYFVAATEAGSWLKAEKNCQEVSNGHLAFPESTDWLDQFNQQHSSSAFYVATHLTFPDGSQFPGDLFNSGSPTNADGASHCGAVLNGKMQDAPCNELYRHVCEIDAQSSDSSPDCSFPNEYICNSSSFNFSQSGPPFPIGTTAELQCKNGLLRGECLGGPFNWYFEVPDHWLSKCGVCDPSDCTTPPPPMPCAYNTTEIHEPPFSHGETLNYTCPVHAVQNATLACVNTTWVGGCTSDPHVLTYNGECYYLETDSEDTMEKQESFCHNLYQGHLAPPIPFPSGFTNKTVYVGAHLTFNDAIYNCSGTDCDSIWSEELDPLTIQSSIHNSTKCLALDPNGFIALDCLSPAGALCRVVTGRNDFSCPDQPPSLSKCSQITNPGEGAQVSYGAKRLMSCSCESELCQQKTKAICTGYPMYWYLLYPTLECQRKFAFDGHCYGVVRQQKNVTDAALYCNNFPAHFLAPAMASTLYTQKVHDFYRTRNMNTAVPLLVGNHLTHTESAYTLETQPEWDALWMDEKNDVLVPVSMNLSKSPLSKCLALDVESQRYINVDCSTEGFFACRSDSTKFNATCGEIPTVSDHTVLSPNALEPYSMSTEATLSYSCPNDVTGDEAGQKTAICLGYPLDWLFPDGIKICQPITTIGGRTGNPVCKTSPTDYLHAIQLMMKFLNGNSNRTPGEDVLDKPTRTTANPQKISYRE
ncbi:unnamed protein product, partial [Cyprideis torosa]